MIIIIFLLKKKVRNTGKNKTWKWDCSCYDFRILMNIYFFSEPNFVGSFDIGDYVLFFFRETAVEYINCGKSVYSRVARVCKKDTGGKNILSQNWATYLKARLNCSIPGEFPFYFNEIRKYNMNTPTFFYSSLKNLFIKQKIHILLSIVIHFWMFSIKFNYLLISCCLRSIYSSFIVKSISAHLGSEKPQQVHGEPQQ